MFVIAVGEVGQHNARTPYTGNNKARHCARLITRRSERPYYAQDCITAQISALDVLVRTGKQLDVQRNAHGLTTHTQFVADVPPLCAKDEEFFGADGTKEAINF